MNNIEGIIQVIYIGFFVAKFLLNTYRVLKAIELSKECLSILSSKEGLKERKVTTLILCQTIYVTLLEAYSLVSDYTNAVKYGEKVLRLLCECGERSKQCELRINLSSLYLCQSNYAEAQKMCEKALVISMETGNRKGEAVCHTNLGNVYNSVGQYEKAREHLGKALAITKEIWDRNYEALCCINLGNVCQSVGEYEKSREHLENALAITKETGDSKVKATCHGNLGVVYQYIGKYDKAREHIEKALTIRKEIGDRHGLAVDSANLGSVLLFLGHHRNAKEYTAKALVTLKEIGNRSGEATCYTNLGAVYQHVGKYEKSQEYLEKALTIKREIGDRSGEALCYKLLGDVYQFAGKCEKAREYHEKSLAISKELGDRNGEASSYSCLGAVYYFVGKSDKARENLEKALPIEKETRNRTGEASCHNNLGTVYQSGGEYEKAREHCEKALAITKEIGHRYGEASCCSNLGILYQSVGEYEKARELHDKSLSINKEIGAREAEGNAHVNLGYIFQSCGKYSDADEQLQKALLIYKEIGDKKGEATSYGNLGTLFHSLGDYDKALEYYEKALAINKDIYYSDGQLQAAVYGNIGTVFLFLGKYEKAEEYQKKSFEISARIGNVKKQYISLCNLSWAKMSLKKFSEALFYLKLSIQKCEHLRGSLRNNDQFKISFSDVNLFPYWELRAMLCVAKHSDAALHVSELGRARALADLMSAQFSVENPLTNNLQSWTGIKKVMEKECNCTCLYVSYYSNNLLLWILKESRIVQFQSIEVNEMVLPKGLPQNLDDFFANQRFRRFDVLPEEHYEDRSLDGIQRKLDTWEGDRRTSYQIATDDTGKQDPELNLPLCYKLIISPVAALLEDPEIIIAPEGSLYNIPFSALPDESGKYLSETHRIRIVPSLTTLKLIQDSPADYHCQNGALIVGNPDVGRVRHKGCLKKFKKLPFAEKEANLIGEMLGVKPLLGQQATKHAVLQVINSVSLIHFAAHGDSERGEIALAPVRTPDRTPREEDYLLTMSDILKVRLRAKLVVLSCCHSGRGQIKAEGVVGIARSFLGSGARSVLVALWALEDRATEQFMIHFYEHLVRGESASKSLHEAMKWMRYNGFSNVRQWAPFMLIGDNVAFDFEAEGV